jgi:hypothetical protein
MLMPPLTTEVPSVPAPIATNMRASLQLRVLNRPHDAIPIGNSRMIPKVIQASRVANHPTGNMKYLRRRFPEAEIRQPEDQITVEAECLPPLATDHMRSLVQEFIGLKENMWLQEVTEPVPFDQWVARYPLMRQEQLRVARQEVLDRGYMVAKDAKVKNFLKYETSVTFTDPRNISPRSDHFLSVLGPYISALDQAAHHAPYLVKGLSISERERKLSFLSEWESWLEIDYSRFDMTLSKEWMEHFEYIFITSRFPEELHPLLHQCVRLTWKTFGVNIFLLYYTVIGGRCSGDAHTSVLNGVINRFNIWLCLMNLPHGTWKSVHEGDDGAVGIKAQWLQTAASLLTIVNSYGFSVKVLTSDRLENITFCGRWLSICDEGGVREMADVRRTLSKFHVTLSPGKVQTLLLAKAYSYHHTDHDTPIIGALCWGIIHYLEPILSRHARNKALREAKVGRYLLREDTIMKWGKPNTTDAMRAQVFERCGIDYAAQLAFEHECMSWPHKGLPKTIFTPWTFTQKECPSDRFVLTDPLYMAHYHPLT